MQLLANEHVFNTWQLKKQCGNIYRYPTFRVSAKDDEAQPYFWRSNKKYSYFLVTFLKIEI